MFPHENYVYTISCTRSNHLIYSDKKTFSFLLFFLFQRQLCEKLLFIYTRTKTTFWQLLSLVFRHGSQLKARHFQMRVKNKKKTFSCRDRLGKEERPISRNNNKRERKEDDDEDEDDDETH